MRYPDIPLFLQPLEVRDDYGYVGSGVSNAHYVMAENGSEYLIKGPSLCPGSPYFAVNELICALLAVSLGLPVLDYRLLRMGNDLFFGSAWMQKDTYTSLTRALYDRCYNQDRLYDIIAFDTWVGNIDRHHGNLLVRKRNAVIPGAISPGMAEQYMLLMNDHSHAILPPGAYPDHLELRVSRTVDPPTRIDFAHDVLTDISRLRTSIETMESLEEGVTRAVVQSVPEEWLPSGEKALVANYLVMRQSQIRSLIQRERVFFSQLGTGDL